MRSSRVVLPMTLLFLEVLAATHLEDVHLVAAPVREHGGHDGRAAHQRIRRCAGRCRCRLPGLARVEPAAPTSPANDSTRSLSPTATRYCLPPVLTIAYMTASMPACHVKSPGAVNICRKPAIIADRDSGVKPTVPPDQSGAGLPRAAEPTSRPPDSQGTRSARLESRAPRARPPTSRTDAKLSVQVLADPSAAPTARPLLAAIAGDMAPWTDDPGQLVRTSP